jgi:hypothetical protein
MSGTKNPENEAENPAPMPPHQTTKMAPLQEAPPGLEQDSHGNPIPLSQRTKENQQKALSGRKDG